MEQILAYLAVGYLILMSIIGFSAMGMDKQRAIKKAWRIPERTLFIIAFAGGGVGSFLGMHAFHHKTKHMKFVILLPMAALLYALLGYQLLKIL